MWPLALILFTASIFVPMMKLGILSFLLFSVHRSSSWRPVERTRLYRLTEAIGRWSMVDIYVVTILVALVRLGNLATIEAGAGAIFFGAVVVITIWRPNRSTRASSGTAATRGAHERTTAASEPNLRWPTPWSRPAGDPRSSG